jgi:hypothetical protein
MNASLNVQSPAMDEVIALFTLVDGRMKDSAKDHCTEQEICEYQYLRSFPF